ncbi:MAG: uroporphyrinogen decarboxylase family protein [bacterium]
MNIHYPLSEIDKSRKRLEHAFRFAYFDRTPIWLGIEARYLLHARGITFAEYFSDPKTQLIHQLENLKWRIENIPDDWFSDPKLIVYPDFQNVTNASGCGCEIYWQENETPQAIESMSTIDDLTNHKLPDWRRTLWGKKLEWYYTMKELVQDVDVRLNGERIPLKVTVGINADSPFMTAVDLAGANFYEWMMEAPDECHAFLTMLTKRYIEVESEFRKVLDRPVDDGLNYSDDSAQVVSPEQYREFCVPYAKKLYDLFGCYRADGRTMHLCGRNVHLHGALLNDLKITMLTGYGSGNLPEEMSMLAGKVILHGNIDPMILERGSVAEVETEARRILATLASSGGIILGDGFNVVPGTDVSKFEAIQRVSIEYGMKQSK